eukprot:TRINITY_DN996_c0_g1_i1.p1 TRINITY_DN996_c0_g1~~TRINITY_DN996_c0_g1_i1.p1  ORF type:complete len:462 (-),score=40.98 TRINITY_DN996_c0_g1_i1:23-1408(-)
MVYNSGIWIRTPSWEFFTAFKFKMHPNPSNIYDCDSLCNLTFPGWFTNRKNGKMGCFQGYKNKLFQNTLNTHSIFSKRDISRNEAEKDAELEKIKYEDLAFLVKHINSLKDFSWNAKMNPEFKGLTLKVLKERLGVPQHKGFNVNKFVGLLKKSPVFLHPGAKCSKYQRDEWKDLVKKTGFDIDPSDNIHKYYFTHVFDIDPEDLPKSWDWRNVDGKNYMNKAYRQICGSCYAAGTIKAIEARIRVATHNKIKPKLSIKDVVGCSWYSEGCEGGESFHTAKFGHDFGFIPEENVPFLNSKMKCNHNEFLQNIEYSTQIYEYVGGYFGYTKGIESLMMREIRARGPLQASILCPITFSFYKEGVMNCENTFMPKRSLHESEEDILRRVNANFSPVEHLITVMGWGETSSGEKYWICMNSWGENFGDKGSFLLRRGTNACNIEAKVAAYLPRNLSEQHLSFLH